MDDKFAREIAKELKLIRRELQQSNKPPGLNVGGEVPKEMTYDEMIGNVRKDE